MKWKHLPIVAFDTETTGLNPHDGDRIIEFAAVRFEIDQAGKVVSQEEQSMLINPGIPIPRIVRDITGINDSDVAGAPPFAAVASQIKALLSDAITVAHNYPFDLAFLVAELEAAGQAWPEPIAELDTLDMSLRVFKGAKSHRLSELTRRLDVTLEGAHRATNDAAACGLCFIQMVKQAKIEDDLQTLLDWSNGIGRPPDSAPFSLDGNNQIIFTGGPHANEPVGAHPIHLAWMLHAKERRQGVWDWRFDATTRAWVQRWLNVRGAGRKHAVLRSLRPDDWGLVSCISPPVRSN